MTREEFANLLNLNKEAVNKINNAQSDINNLTNSNIANNNAIAGLNNEIQNISN